jgi:hypothetical protein
LIHLSGCYPLKNHDRKTNRLREVRKRKDIACRGISRRILREGNLDSHERILIIRVSIRGIPQESGTKEYAYARVMIVVAIAIIPKTMNDAMYFMHHLFINAFFLANLAID